MFLDYDKILDTEGTTRKTNLGIVKVTITRLMKALENGDGPRTQMFRNYPLNIFFPFPNF